MSVYSFPNLSLTPCIIKTKNKYMSHTNTEQNYKNVLATYK